MPVKAVLNQYAMLATITTRFTVITHLFMIASTSPEPLAILLEPKSLVIAAQVGYQTKFVAWTFQFLPFCTNRVK